MIKYFTAQLSVEGKLFFDDDTFNNTPVFTAFNSINKPQSKIAYFLLDILKLV